MKGKGQLLQLLCLALVYSILQVVAFTDMYMLERLEKKVDDLSENVYELREFNARLRIAAGVLSADNGDLAGHTTVKPPVNLRRLTIEPADNDTTRFIVRFDSKFPVTVECTFHRYTFGELSKTAAKPQKFEISKNTKEVACTSESSEDEFKFCFKIFSQESSVLILCRSGYKPLEKIEIDGDDIIFPTAKIDSPSAIFYEEGIDAEVSLTVDRSDERSNSQTSERIYIYDADKDVYSSYRENAEEFFSVKKTKLSEKRDRKTYVFSTSENPGTSGLVIFSFYRWAGSEPVKEVELSKAIVLKPSYMSERYSSACRIGFVEGEDNDFIEGNSFEAKICRETDGDCLVTCAAIGADELNIDDVEQTEASSSLAQADAKKWIEYGAILKARTEVTAPWEDSSAAWNQTKQCRASCYSSGKQIVRNVTVQFLMDPQIQEESHAEKIYHDEDGKSFDVNMTCTVRGIPTPRITFEVYLPFHIVHSYDPDLIFQSTDGLEVTATKTIPWGTEPEFEDLDIEFINCFGIVDGTYVYVPQRLPISEKRPVTSEK